MRKLIGFLMCLPCVGLIVGIIYWACTSVTLKDAVVHMVCWAIGVIVACIVMLVTLFCAYLFQRGLILLFSKGSE